jgi:hypothetical protein
MVADLSSDGQRDENGSHHCQRHRDHERGDEASNSDDGRSAILMNPNDRVLVIGQVHGKCSTPGQATIVAAKPWK